MTGGDENGRCVCAAKRGPIRRIRWGEGLGEELSGLGEGRGRRAPVAGWGWGRVVVVGGGLSAELGDSGFGAIEGLKGRFAGGVGGRSWLGWVTSA